MKVLFINPNPYRPAVPPVGLEYVAEATREAGHAVVMFDTVVEDVASLPARVRSERPDVIGITLRNLDTGNFFNNQSFVTPAADLIASLRTYFSGPIVVGGAGFTLLPVALLETLGADLGVVGEGETVFPALLANLSTPQLVPNVVYRGADGRARATERRFEWKPTIKPRRDLIDHRAYYDRFGGFKNHTIANVQTARGCDRFCSYCAEPRVIGRNLIAREPDEVVDEVERIVAKGITDRFFFVDSEFNVSPAHATAVCEALLRRGVQINWAAYLIPDHVDRELVTLMARAGCRQMFWTMESASDTVLKSLAKSHRAADVVRVGRLCGELGLDPIILLMFGGPRETAATVAETWRHVRDIPNAHFGVVTGVRVYPSTPLARQMLHEGAIRQESDLIPPVYYRPEHVRQEVFPAVLEHFGDMPNAVVLGPQRKTKFD